MSRIGNKQIVLPAGVTVALNGNVATVTGPKGSLNVTINEGIVLHQEGEVIHLTRENEKKQTKQNHGTTRANLYNAVVGVHEGYKKTLELKGIGYKAIMKGTSVEIWAGYSHTTVIVPEPGVTITCVSATEIDVTGISKQAVGQTAALIRGVRPPEPYLGKGIRYKGEYVALKEGKKAGGKK